MTYRLLSIQATICDSIEELFSTPDQPLQQASILLCVEGSVDVRVNGELQHVMPSDILFCLPGSVVSNVMPSADFRCQSMSIPSAVFHDAIYETLRSERNWYGKLSYLNRHPLIHLHDNELTMARNMEQIFRIFSQSVSEAYRTQMVTVIAQGLILLMLSWVDAQMAALQAEAFTVLDPSLSSKQDKHLQGFMELLQEQKGCRRDVAWYADQLQITPKYLAFICKKYTDRSPLQFINEIAIREMKQQLLVTSYNIKQISFAMNFPNASMFCKYFRLHTGMTPLEFREYSRH